jgi:hypothetical protein
MSPGKAISLDLPGQIRTVTQKEELQQVAQLATGNAKSYSK